MAADEFTQLWDADIEKIGCQTLIDAEKIAIDPTMPYAQRMQRYWEQVKNPYCFRCGRTPVKVCFAPEGAQLEEKLKSYFLRIKR